MRKPSSTRTRPRYVVRSADSGPKELLITKFRSTAIERAEWYALMFGWRTWVWNVRTGETIHRAGGEA